MIQQEKRACVMVAHRGPVVLGKRRTLNYEKRPLNAATRSQRVLSRSDLGPWPHAGAPRAARSRLRPGKAPPSLRGAPRVPGQNTERGHTRPTHRRCAVRPGQRAPGQESQHGSQRGAPASSAPGRCARHARVHCSRRRHRGPRDPSGNPAVAPRACEQCPDTRGPRTRGTSARRAPRRPRTRGTGARRGSAPGRALRSAPGASLWRRPR